MNYPQITLQRSIFFVLISLSFYSCSKDKLIKENTQITSNQSQIEFTRDYQFENQFLIILNDYLNSNNYNQLERIPEADEVANLHTQNMIEVNSLHHDNFSERQHYFVDLGYTTLRENLAMGYSNPETLLNAWLQSPSHKSAIESNSHKTGLSILKNQNGKYFITQLYIK